MLELKKRIFTSILLLFLLFLIFRYQIFLVYSLIVLGVFAILEFINILNKIFNSKFYFILFNLVFCSYIFVFSFFFIYFSNFLELKILLFAFLLSCVASDIGGFVFGKFFKGPKLTKISPKKTYAGALGSVLFSTIIISIILLYFFEKFTYIIFLLGINISIFCQIGDLVISLLKRKAKIKDTGNILPGHGGILDRIDGILLGLPAGIIFFILIY